MFVRRKMNTYLIFYLCVLLIYSVLWVCITLGFYSVTDNLPSAMWYVGGAVNFWEQSSGTQVTVYLFSVGGITVQLYSLKSCLKLGTFRQKTTQWTLTLFLTGEAVSWQCSAQRSNSIICSLP